MKQAVYDASSQCQGKRRFASYAEAERNTFPKDDVYRCPHCMCWHISGSPRARRTKPLPHRTSRLYAGFDDEGLTA